MTTKINLSEVQKPSGVRMTDEDFRQEVGRTMTNLSVRLSLDQAVRLVTICDVTKIKKANIMKQCFDLGLDLVVAKMREEFLAATQFASSTGRASLSEGGGNKTDCLASVALNASKPAPAPSRRR